MSESQFHAATKAELKRQEQLLKVLREQAARQKSIPPQVAPPVVPAQVTAPREGIDTQQVVGKIFKGTGEFNVPRLPDVRPVDKFFQDARQRMSFRRKNMQEAAARERAETQIARQKDAKEQKEVEDKRDKLKEGTPEQKRRHENDRDRIEREQKWADSLNSKSEPHRNRDHKRKEGESFTAF